MKKGSVLVTDAQMRSSLAVIRSLGRNGLTVTGGETTRFATGLFSKYCKNRFIYPNPEERPEKFIEKIIEHLSEEEYDCIIPVADACLKPFMDNYERINGITKLTLPPPDIFYKAYDKVNTIRIAEKMGIDHPGTIVVENIEDFKNIENVLSFPLIIKPSISSGSRGFHIAKDMDDLMMHYKNEKDHYETFLVQEFIENGGEIGIYIIMDKGSVPLGYSVQKRLRSYPINGGPSTYRKTIKNERTKKAYDIAVRVLKEIKWVGVAMVEFRIDKKDQRIKLMEINPRFWGSLQLSILSGVDFPYLLYKVFMDERIGDIHEYKEGVYCRWLLPGDILWFLSSKKSWKNVKDFFKFRDNYDIISRDDPLPVIGFFLAVIRYLFNIKMWKFVLRR